MRAEETYCLVMPFNRNLDGDLLPGEATPVSSKREAKWRAQHLLGMHVGALAFLLSGNSETGEFGMPEVIASYGRVDMTAL